MIYDDPIELGRRIAAARAYAGLGLDDLAEKLGISVPTLRRWTKGEERSLGTTTTERRLKVDLVRNATGCPVSFFGESDATDDDQLSVRVERLMAQMDYVLAVVGQTYLQQRPDPTPSVDDEPTTPRVRSTEN